MYDFLSRRYPVNNDGWAIIDSVGVMLAQPSSFCANVGPTITSQRSLGYAGPLRWLVRVGPTLGQNSAAYASTSGP